MDVPTFHALNIIFILRMAFYQAIDEFISNIGENIEVIYVIVFILFYFFLIKVFYVIVLVLVLYKTS